MKNELLARGRVEWLCVNGQEVASINFRLDGPEGDKHSGFVRKLSGHDGVYVRTSSLSKGDEVFNWRTWTGLSAEELGEVERSLGLSIPRGTLLENIVFSGISDFSKLAPTTRLIFPKRSEQVILAVWEENGPCKGVGQRLAEYYGEPDLCRRLIAEAQGKRGVMGLVLSPGVVEVGDEVLVYPPAE